MINNKQRFTDDERERVAEAFDILRAVFADVRDRRGCKGVAGKIDRILGKLENLMDL